MPEYFSGVTANARTDIGNTAMGILSEPAPFATYPSTAVPVANAASGTLTLALVGLRAGDIVTNIIVHVTSNGTGLTFAKCGLFTSTGGFLAATASASAAFNAGTTPRYQVVPLTAPFPITRDGGYYVGYLQYGSGATGATLPRSSTGAAVVGTSPHRYASVTLQTDISADVTVAGPTTNFWLGCN